MAELNEYLYKIKELDPYGNGETIPLILEKGGSEHPMILYKRFRGQEPTVDALLERSGLKSKSE